jgi:hypothetical protein
MLTWLAEFLRDIRFGVRHLAKSPGFTSIAVLSLALGIMATTAIYSVIHAVVLDPFPYKDVDNLMSVKVWDPGQRGYRLGYSTDQFLEIAERNTIFEGVIASTISDVLWTDGGEPQRLRGNYGTFNTFQVMGVPPLIGRATAPDDARPDAAPVAVLGYRFWQHFALSPTLIARTQGNPLDSLPAVRNEVAALDKNLPLYDVKTMRQHLGLALLPARLAGSVLGVFGLVALTLAAAGIYGVMAYSVAQRTREIGIRMALGANARDVLRLIARQGMTLASIGMAIGLAAALALTQLLKSLLFGVSATDPLTFVVIALLLTAVALLACWIPARRATKVDPMVALRCE